jgi:hypothetical protein
MSVYSFSEMLSYSRGVREQTDALTIQRMIAGCVEVCKTSERDDRAGVDYVAALRKGATVLIDAKTRKPGCSKYWRQGPELALEVWSVMPGGKYQMPEPKKKVGWTLCEAKNVDYILFTFDPLDSREVFLYPYQLLRMTFRRMLPQWHMLYKKDVQDSGTWQSQCLFVPESVVWSELRNSMRAEAA